jgi:hypothetical protein
MATYTLYRSHRPGKKYCIETPTGKQIHFGAEGYADYTMHKDAGRKANYISRHKARENWGKSGINSAGFWSRWLLWNAPSLSGSIRSVNSKFGIRVRRAS